MQIYSEFYCSVVYYSFKIWQLIVAIVLQLSSDDSDSPALVTTSCANAVVPDTRPLLPASHAADSGKSCAVVYV